MPGRVGAIALTAGWPWGSFLVAWFVTASALSRWGRLVKAQRTGVVTEKGVARDAGQVVAKGGVFAVLALASLLAPASDSWAPVAGAAALAAAGSDTAATEVGTLWGGTPLSLRTGRRAPPGTSGAVSLAGTIGMVVCAVWFAGLAAAVGLIAPSEAALVAAAGVSGALADTLMGAWVQARRYCPTCARDTEQPVHRCGTGTVPSGGLSWLTNDRVNLACTVSGALVAWGLR